MSKPKTADAHVTFDYHSLFQMLPAGHIVFEAKEPHRFLEANDAHLAMNGKTRAIIGQPFFEVYPDVSDTFQKSRHSELHTTIDSVVESGQPETLESFRYDIPNDTGGYLVRFWRLSYYLIRDSDGTTTVLQISEDVTQQTLEEKEHQYRQWQFEETLGTGLIGVWQWDIESDILIADKNLARTFGVDTSLASTGIPLETFTSAIHPDDRDRIVKAITLAIKKEHAFEAEYRTVDADGNTHWVMARGKVETDQSGTKMFPGVLVDITDRKRAEELVEYQALIAESIDDAVITLNKKGVITGWNHGAELMFGYSEKEALGNIGETVLVLLPGFDRIAIRQKAYDGSAWRGNLSYHHKDGHIVDVMASVSALRDSSGTPIGLVTIMQNLTELAVAQSKAQMEKAKLRSIRQEAKLLKRKNEELVALNRTKDEFIALTSHQLRTPATGTKQYLGMLLEGYTEPLGPRQRSFVQSAFDCNERQLRVVDDILRVAQVDLDKITLRPELTDIGLFLRQIVDEQTGKFEKRDHHLEYVPPEEILEVEIDRDRLRMALDNIIDNADKYTEPGKRITLRLSKGTGHVSIEIEDEGVGIEEKDFEKLFQKFSRIDNPLSVEVGGSGLGLYWSKRIIMMHGGDVEVRSKLGEGTTFTVTIPLTRRVAAKPTSLSPIEAVK